MYTNVDKTSECRCVSDLHFPIVRLFGSIQDGHSKEAWPGVDVGLLTVSSEDAVISTAIIIEGGIVMENLKNLPQALCLVFGLTYTLNLAYPESMKNTMRFIQQVMLGMGKKEKLLPKLQSLKNLLSF